ncbi:MAG: hypothetical protein RL514_278 [Verrucomicrobiota bacterium]|jgi:ClpP class serine protease
MNTQTADYIFARAPIWLAESNALLAWAARVSLAATPGTVAGKMADGSDRPQVLIQGGVMTIPIQGPLLKNATTVELSLGFCSYTGISAALETARTSPGLRGVALLVDSPGGEVSGLLECVDSIVATTTKLPVQTIVDGNCCSAAYWLAAKTNRISASKSSNVGSVGAVISHLSVSNALAMRGITATVISSPTGKASAHPFQQLTDEGRASLQGKVDELATDFRTSVLSSRGGIAKGALTGETFFASRAKALGLVDVVGETVNEVVRRLSSASPGAQLTAPSSAQFIAKCRALAASGKTHGEAITAAVKELPADYEAWLAARLNGQRAAIFPN